MIHTQRGCNPPPVLPVPPVLQVNNTLAHSEEEAEPDPDLRLGYDVLSCLTTVSKLASKSGAYCFEPFVWQHE